MGWKMMKFPFKMLPDSGDICYFQGCVGLHPFFSILNCGALEEFLCFTCFLAQEYVGQTLLQEAVRNHGRVDLMEKKNGEKLAASWWLQPDWGKDISFNIRGQHGIPSPENEHVSSKG